MASQTYILLHAVDFASGGLIADMCDFSYHLESFSGGLVNSQRIIDYNLFDFICLYIKAYRTNLEQKPQKILFFAHKIKLSS